MAVAEIAGSNFARIADRRAVALLLEKAQPAAFFRLALVYAALGDHIVQRHVVGLRVNRLEHRELVADADHAGRCGVVRAKPGKRAVEVAAAVAEPIALSVDADDRQQDGVGHEFS